MAAGLLALGGGCDNENDFDHTPPAGMGSIAVRNNTSSDMNVFIDGQFIKKQSDNSDRYYDLYPGVYRVVLDQADGDQNFRGDIDVLEGKLTVMDTSFGSGTRYDVYIYFK